MKLVAQMDDILSIDITRDSTFAILLEAQNRGHEIFYYLPESLGLQDNAVKANVHKIKLQNKIGKHVQIIESNLVDLTSHDVILVRQDPPFDMNYITSTYLLESIKDQVKIINDPSEIRNCPEKIFVTNFLEFTPPTLITSDFDQIKEFRNKYKEIIIKPLYGSGGEGIFYLKEDDKNINSLVEVLNSLYKSPLVIQKFLKEVESGDKRILLLNGEVIGAVNRVCAKGDFRSNFHVGGGAQKTELNDREKLICLKLGTELKKRGLLFVGIDVIGDYVTEINVTSPTGIQEINELSGIRIDSKILDFLEQL
jgi:glutathione synthase